jgi:tetratricopeptide (TPR) repeat protein
LGGRYEVLRELARGGMGRVLLCRDRVLDRELAVKTLLAGGEEGAQLRFVEEAQVSGQLAHPNIVPIHALGWEEGELYLVMKRVEGRDLDGIVKALAAGDPKTERRYPLNRLLRLFLKVCEAVAYAHERGVLHRDLKPANVMVGQGDEVLVMDWGLAKPVGTTTPSGGSSEPTRARAGTVISKVRGAADADGDGGLTTRGAVVGTPAYMPPEQAGAEEALDLRADIYALGATLYELLTLRRPYAGGQLQVLTALFKGPPPVPRKAAPEREVPPALEAIVLRAMARERDGRYPSALALADDVAAYLDGRAVSSYREGLGEALGRLARRHRAAVVSTVVALVAVLGFGLAFLLAVRLQEREAEQKAVEAAEATEGAARAQAIEEEASRRAEAARAETQALVARLQPARDAVAAVGSAVTFAVTTRRLVKVSDLIGMRKDLVQQLQEIGVQLDRDAARERPLEVLAGLRERLPALRQLVDGFLAEALVTRDPWRLIALRETLGLDSERGRLLMARAYLRTWQHEAAQRELARLDSSADAFVALPARALGLWLARADPEEQEAAFTAALGDQPSAAWLYFRRAQVRARLTGRRVLAGDQALEAGFDPDQDMRDDLEEAVRLAPLDPWLRLFVMDVLTPVGGRLDEYGSVLDQMERDNREIGKLLHARKGLRTYWVTTKQFLRRKPKVWAGRENDVEKVLEKIRDGELRLPVEVYATWAGRPPMTVGRWEYGLSLAQEALDADPEHLEALSLAAEALCRLGRHEEAQATARRGLALAPQHGGLSFALGESLRRQGRYAEARPHLRRGAEEARDAEPWLRLAQCLERLDDPAAWKLGVRAGRRALALDPVEHEHEPRVVLYPNDPVLHRTLGLLRLRQGKLARALLHFNRALSQSQSLRIVGNLELLTPEELKRRRRRPRDLQDALLLGAVHERLGLFREAAGNYRLAARDEALRAEAGARLARLEKAHGDLRRPAKPGRAPDRGEPTLARRAQELLRAGRTPDALRLLDRGLEANPRDVILLALRGQARLLTKDFAAAEADLRRSCQLSQTPSAAALANLGSAQLALGKLEDARSSYRKALQVEPNMPGAERVKALLERVEAQLEGR